MPHATETTTTNGAMTNGSSPKNNSKFLSHLQSYPVVNDSVNTFQNHPYGKKSIEIGENVYNKYGKAVEPYLEKPYGYVKPYAAKADELADAGLGHVDERFPIVKEETNSLVEKGKGVVWWPFSVAGQGRDYVMGTWNDEYTKTANHNSRGAGISTSIMAIISTELKIASDFFQAVADFLGPKYEEGKNKAQEVAQEAQSKANDVYQNADAYVQQGKETAKQYQAVAADKVEEYGKAGEQKANEAQKVGSEKTDQIKKDVQKAQAESVKRMQGQK